MKKILLDTNFLLIPYQFNVDIFSQIDRIADFKYELFVLDRSLEELRKIINEQKGSDKDAAKIALKLIAIKGIKVVKANDFQSVDDAIVDASSKGDFIVATQDKELKKKLTQKGVPIIILRQKKKLEILSHNYIA